jgi:hypothetical protein
VSDPEEFIQSGLFVEGAVEVDHAVAPASGHPLGFGWVYAHDLLLNRAAHNESPSATAFRR